MYIIRSKEENKANAIYYLYLLAIIAIGWIGFFFIKLRDSFAAGGGKVDKLVINYVQSIRNDTLSTIMVFISKSGDTIVAIIFTILIIIYFYMRNKEREAKFYAVNILAIAIISQSVKYLSRRPRPTGDWLVDIGGYSFPSGHSIISMAGALILIYFILSFLNNRILAHIISIFIFIYAALIGLSRVYVGVHYISDVVGGWAIASLWVFITLLIFRRRSVDNITKYIR
ncbi:phosphatase PAP2 family protein [Clostridium bovifaecis]|uniref:Phosphatase PAP2 family protein n=1 Tax=Clostridium bovifaecis TaxID=2184719 RepID=A0A6I6F5Y5_9CLOT|nr:phosphatase PAP2 family protein [Clostridium bovifaecis]